jgi:hypothetical protein
MEGEMGRACEMHGREEKCVQVLVRKWEGNRQLAGPKCRLEDNFKSTS